MFESLQTESNFCSYLVDRINKLIPMCKAVRATTRIKNLTDTSDTLKDIPTIELMNGKKIYITRYRVSNSGYYSPWSTFMKVNIIAFSVDEGRQYFDVFKDKKKGGNYYFYERDKYYKNLSIVNFMKVVNELVVEDLVNLVSAE